MDETTLSWSLYNFVTVVLMVALAFVAVGLVARLVQKWQIK